MWVGWKILSVLSFGFVAAQITTNTLFSIINKCLWYWAHRTTQGTTVPWVVRLGLFNFIDNLFSNSPKLKFTSYWRCFDTSLSVGSLEFVWKSFDCGPIWEKHVFDLNRVGVMNTIFNTSPMITHQLLTLKCTCSFQYRPNWIRTCVHITVNMMSRSYVTSFLIKTWQYWLKLHGAIL